MSKLPNIHILKSLITKEAKKAEAYIETKTNIDDILHDEFLPHSAGLLAIYHKIEHTR